MVEPEKIGKVKEGLGSAVGTISKGARSASAKVAEQVTDFKEATVVTLEKVTEHVGDLKESSAATLEKVTEQVSELKDSATATIERAAEKKPDPYEEGIAEYNGVFTAMSDKGLSLLRQRERSTDVIELVALLVNSIVNTPKSFEADFAEISVHKAQFLEVEEFARKDLAAARKSAAAAGAGITAGAAVASMAPTAAMWVATTFGTASTGTAISTLSGAVATKAALAWIGGGALAAGGGGGTAAGTALLALAGPIGWTVAGATVLASIALFAKKKFENREAKQNALTAVKLNTARAKAAGIKIDDLLQRTTTLRELLLQNYIGALDFRGADFIALSDTQRSQLVALVNNTKACAALLSQIIEQDADND